MGTRPTHLQGQVRQRCCDVTSVAHSDCCVCAGMQISRPGSTHDPCRCLLTPNPRETTANPLFLLALDRAPPAASNCVFGDRWGWGTGRHVSTGWSDCLVHVGWLVLPASHMRHRWLCRSHRYTLCGLCEHSKCNHTPYRVFVMIQGNRAAGLTHDCGPVFQSPYCFS